MELVKADPRIAPTLDRDERELILARFESNIKELSEKELITFFLGEIGRLHVESGQSVNEGILDASIRELTETCTRYFSTLTKSEIKIAFKKGILGEYGEYFGLNNKTYYQFFKAFLASQKRVEANRKQGLYINAQSAPKSITDEEKRVIMTKASLDAFEYVRMGNYFDDMGNAVYNFIDRNWKIPFGLQRKVTFLQQARVKIKAKLSDQLMTTNESTRNKVRHQIKMIEEDNTEEMKVEAKKIAINAYFKDLLELGEELNTIVK